MSPKASALQLRPVGVGACSRPSPETARSWPGQVHQAAWWAVSSLITSKTGNMIVLIVDEAEADGVAAWEATGAVPGSALPSSSTY